MADDNTGVSAVDPTNSDIGEYVFSLLDEPWVDPLGVPARYSLFVEYAGGQVVTYDFLRPTGGRVVALTAINYKPPIDPSILAEKQS